MVKGAARFVVSEGEDLTLGPKTICYSELCVDFIKVTGIEKASKRRPWKWEESTRLIPLNGPYMLLN